ncbi:MAG: hypothetical protein OXG67_01600 [bacterium]|nr:hypothetical protein [bacterium]
MIEVALEQIEVADVDRDHRGPAATAVTGPIDPPPKRAAHSTQPQIDPDRGRSAPLSGPLAPWTPPRLPRGPGRGHRGPRSTQRPPGGPVIEVALEQIDVADVIDLVAR